jgi:hypothetical protein
VDRLIQVPSFRRSNSEARKRPAKKKPACANLIFWKALLPDGYRKARRRD